MSLIVLMKMLPTENSASAKSSFSNWEFLRMYPLDPTRPAQAVPVPSPIGLPPPEPTAQPSWVAPVELGEAPATHAAIPACLVTSTIAVEPQRPRRSTGAAPLPLMNVGEALCALPEAGEPLPPANFAELLHRVEHLSSLPRRKHRDTVSAVRAVGRVLDRPLHEVPTAPALLRPLLTKAHPALAEMSPARWSTVRSLVLDALSRLGVEVMPGRARRPLSPEWQVLYTALTDKKCRYGVSRMVHFFSDTDVQPAEVDPGALARYRDKLLATSLRQDVNPETTFKTALHQWGRAVTLMPGWPSAALATPTCSRRYALPIEMFPASFGTDVAAFLTRSANQDVFAEDYAEPVKDSTNRQRRRKILQLASALVAAGKPAGDVTSLTVLVDIDNARLALRHLLERRDNQKGKGLGAQAQLLLTIARHWAKASPAAIDRLRRMTANLSLKKAGMVPKNRERLRQFDLDANVDVLLELPGRVLRRVEKANTGSRKDALRVMFALAVEILTRAPMRVSNLCAFDLERDLVETRRGAKRHRRISIDAARTKTTKFHFERHMAASTSAMMDVYLTTYRQRVSPSPGTLLFPGMHGEERAVTRFSTAISEFIYRESGLTMNPHLFRHLMVKLHGRLHPDDTETGRLTLGHTTSATIARNYAENRTDSAFARWDDTLARLRGKTSSACSEDIKPRRRP